MPVRRSLVAAVTAGAAGLAIVVIAMWLRTLPAVVAFEATYPGTHTSVTPAPEGIPAWLAWQHYLNALFLILIVRTALNLRMHERPDVFWRRRNQGRLIRTTGQPRRIGIMLWLHLSVDALWVLNGLVYIVLLFATGHWLRLVPTTWDVFPNAASALLQYASFDWPADESWVSYNALQSLSYFTVVFIAAPLAIVTGVRLSSLWPHTPRSSRWLPERATRLVHRGTLWFFVAFTVVHVILVLASDALTNLASMFAANPHARVAGVAWFLIALVTWVAAWTLVRPRVLNPVAGRFGQVIDMRR